MRNLLIGAMLALGLSLSSASAGYVGTGFCDQAVSAAECAKAKAYVESLRGKTDVDTSPAYIKQIDTRYVPAMNTAGGSSN